MDISEPSIIGSSAATLSPLNEFRPLVVGAPRSGFALLTSVIIHVMPLTGGRWTVGEDVFNALVEGVDGVIAESIVAEFAARGITDDLVYNRNFRLLTGGPKWLREDNPEYACFRKYIGVRGMGDFTLVTSHPRQVLDSDEVVHSHMNPALWLQHPGYAAYTKFASVRNPIGILNSSVFSINALASEYIQKFVPADRDNDAMRQRLALYKLTDLAFVRGLVEFLVGYLNDFVKHWQRFHILRWEDLILTPVPTIIRLAKQTGIPLREEQARRIWSILDHVNLTGHHRHNYRAGKGIVSNWREWLVNEHLELFEEMGLEPFMLELGYGSMPRLRESEYTLFQRKVCDFIRRGEICRETDDSDLFTFAFNKSNIASEAFPFRRHPWRRWTRIERSIFASEELELAIWDVAEERTAQVNALLADFLAVRDGSIDEMLAGLRALEGRHAEVFAFAPTRMQTALSKGRTILEHARTSGPEVTGRTVAVTFRPEPRLVDTVSGYNIVAYRESYYGIPQGLGDVHVDEATAAHPEVISGASLTDVRTEILVRRSGSDVEMASSALVAGPVLNFVDPIPEAVSAACRQRLDEGCRRVLLTPFNEFARTVYQSVRAEVAAVGGQLLAPPEAGLHGYPDDVLSAPLSDADLVLVCETDEPQLSDALAGLVDVNVPVVAVRTSRFWADQSLFLISIPKSGTHLLYRFAEAMGYRAALQLQDDPAPASWYCVEYTNSHTSARDFFVDTVRRSPFGNRHHPFMRSPAIFIYRNPLDIVASEAQYYHRDGKTAFAGYLAGLTAEERLLRLIDDPWLLGSVRDRVGAFIPWLELPNVIPVSFEELIGPRGGGDPEQQRRVIWSIQLKLHVPGVPDAFASQVFDPNSPTFDTGQIGRFRDVFTAEAYRRFRALPQDFVEQYGYDCSLNGSQATVPRRAEEFRRRPLRLSSARAEVPFAVQYGYLGYNIVRYRDTYFAVPQGVDVDVRSADVAALKADGRIAIAATAEEARRGAEMLAIKSLVSGSVTADQGKGVAAAAVAGIDHQPRLVREDYHGFNIIQFRGRFFGAPRYHGHIDLASIADIDSLIAKDELLVANSQSQLEQIIDRSSGVAELAPLRESVSQLNEQLASKDRALQQLNEELVASRAAGERLRSQITELEMRVGKEDRALSAKARELERAAQHEQELRQQIARLLTVLADRDKRIGELSIESTEMQEWIRGLQKKLVNTTRGPIRLPWRQ